MADDPERDKAHALVQRIRAGDAQAEAEMVALYAPNVLRMLQAITGDRWCAEDLTQETFAAVLMRLRMSELDDPGGLGRYLRQTARNLLMANNRKKRLRTRTEIAAETLLLEVIDPAPGQLSDLLHKEELALVRQTIAAFRPDRYRQLLYRFYVAGDEKASICADLGLTEVHFNRFLYRARQRFRAAYERRRRKVKKR
jgi:RNA polymerase sigma-70 factor (ECF subfamily)